MTEWLLPSAEMVEMIQDVVLNDGELPGRAQDKSLDDARAPDVPDDVIGQKIITLAQGLIDDGDLAEWLRDTA